jgi:hypothetical protein
MEKCKRCGKEIIEQDSESEESTKEDVAAIKESEVAKKSGKLTLVPLSELTKGT